MPPQRRSTASWTLGALALLACVGCLCLPQTRTITDGLSFPEGPCYADGRLYFVEYGIGKLNAWDGWTVAQVWQEEGSGPCAVLPVGAGELLVTCYDKPNPRLVRIRAGKTVEAIRVDGRGDPFDGPNDLTRAPAGDIYFTASGEWGEKAPPTGKVYRIDKAGPVMPVASGIHYANGLAVIDDGKTLLVAESLENRVLEFPILPGGALGKQQVWKQLEKPPGAEWSTGPDGLKVDSKGNVYVCHFGAASVLVLKPNKSLLRTVKVPYRYVTNVALNSREDTLYVTAVKDNPYKPPYGEGAVFEIPNR